MCVGVGNTACCWREKRFDEHRQVSISFESLALFMSENWLKGFRPPVVERIHIVLFIVLFIV